MSKQFVEIPQYIEEYFEDVVEALKVSGTIDDISVTSLIATVTLNEDCEGLYIGQFVKFENIKKRYKVISVGSENTSFDVSLSAATELSAAGEAWEMILNYDFGHPLEIANRLLGKDQSLSYSYDKFPLVALFVDIPETKDFHKKVGTEADVVLVIAMESEKDMTSPERLNATFKQTLMPIYQMIINYMINDREVIKDGRLLPHRMYRRYYLGEDSKNQNVFNEFADAIEIHDFSVSLQRKYVQCAVSYPGYYYPDEYSDEYANQ